MTDNSVSEANTRLQEFVAAWGLRMMSVESVGGGFSGASVFRIVTDTAEEFALRRVPLHTALSTLRQDTLANLLAGIWSRGVTCIAVPERPVWAPTEARCRSYWLESATDRWMLEQWFPGHSLDGRDLNQTKVAAAFEVLRNWYAAAQATVMADGASQWFRIDSGPSEAIVRRSNMVRELADGELSRIAQLAELDSEATIRNAAARVVPALRSRLDWLQSELRTLAECRVRIQPVLRDVWRAHVLFDDDRVTGLIDLTAAASDHPAVDLSRLLRSWFGTDSQRINESLELALQMELIQPADLRLFTALDVSSTLLSPVTWLRRRLQPDGTQAWTAAMTARLDELADNADSIRMPIVA